MGADLRAGRDQPPCVHGLRCGQVAGHQRRLANSAISPAVGAVARPVSGHFVYGGGASQGAEACLHGLERAGGGSADGSFGLRQRAARLLVVRGHCALRALRVVVGRTRPAASPRLRLRTLHRPRARRARRLSGIVRMTDRTRDVWAMR